MTETVFLDELFDLDSDFYVQAHVTPAQRHAHLAVRMVEMGKAEFASKAARAAATEGAKALEILERRGSDDLEFFCYAKHHPIPYQLRLPDRRGHR